MSRPGRGKRRINTAINRLSEYGFPRPLICQTIDDLLTVYGNNGWVFLEDDSYHIIIEKLPKEDQAEQQQPEENEEHATEGGATSDETVPENGTQTSQAEVPATASEPAKAVAAPNELPDATLAVPLPVPAARHVTSTRRPCYGWIVESESEDELDNGVSTIEQGNPPAVLNHKMNNGVSSTVQARPLVAMRREMEPDTQRGGMLSKRRRPSRWDVPPSY